MLANNPVVTIARQMISCHHSSLHVASSYINTPPTVAKQIADRFHYLETNINETKKCKHQSDFQNRILHKKLFKNQQLPFQFDYFFILMINLGDRIPCKNRHHVLTPLKKIKIKLY